MQMEIIRWLFGLTEQPKLIYADTRQTKTEDLADCWKRVALVNVDRKATPLLVKCSDNFVSTEAMRNAAKLILGDAGLCIFHQIGNNCIAWYNVEQRDTFVLTGYNPNTGTFTSLTEDCSIEDMIQLLPPPQLQTLLPPRNNNNDEGNNNTSSSSKVATRIQPKRAAKDKKMY